MAITIPVNPGYGVIYGAGTGSNGHRILVWAEYAPGQADPVSNTTNISVKFYAALNPAYSSATRSSYGLDSALQVGGSQGQGVKNGAYNFTDPDNLHLLGSYEGPVTHNADGTAQVSISGSFTTVSTYISGGNLQATVTLPPLARQTTLGATDAYIGQTSVVALSVADPAFRHTLAYTFGQRSGWLDSRGNPVDSPQLLSATGLAFAVPVDFYDQIPEAAQGQCTLTCSTYLDGQLIGTPQSTSFTLRADPAVCGPKVSLEVTAVDHKTLELTGQNKRLIPGFSQVQCRIQVQTLYGARPVSVMLQGQNCETELVELSTVSGIPQVQVTDSRGFTAQATDPTITLLDYVPLTELTQVTRDTPTGSTATLIFTGGFWDGDFGATANGLTLEYAVADRPWAQAPAKVENGRYLAQITLEDLTYTQTHPVQIRVADSLCSLERQLTVRKGVPVFDWGEGDFRFHVPVSAPELQSPQLTDILERLVKLEEMIHANH